MKKDLFMHFRVNHVEVPSNMSRNTFQQGNRILKVIQSFKRVLGKPGPNSESKYGLTIAGVLDESQDRIRWGFSMVKGENYVKKDGCDRAQVSALGNDFTTENMTYEEATTFAKELSQEVWNHGYPAMQRLFNPKDLPLAQG